MSEDRAVRKSLALVARKDKAPAFNRHGLRVGRFVANGNVVWSLSWPASQRDGRFINRRLSVQIDGMCSTPMRQAVAALLRVQHRKGWEESARSLRHCEPERAAV